MWQVFVCSVMPSGAERSVLHVFLTQDGAIKFMMECEKGMKKSGIVYYHRVDNTIHH